MLKPTDGIYRTIIDLGGLWRAHWGSSSVSELIRGKGMSGMLAVPAAWNYQLPELQEYAGSVWYAREFALPPEAEKRDVVLRFDGANSNARVYVNGQEAASHPGGCQPFEIDITSHVHHSAVNVLVVSCDGNAAEGRSGRSLSDGVNFGGLIRPVRLTLLPKERITGFSYHTELNRGKAVMHYEVSRSGGSRVVLEIDGRTFSSERGTVEFDSPKLWAPGRPNLYPVSIRLYGKDGRLVDEYRDYAGLRELSVDGKGLLLNGEQVHLRGTNRHEDFTALGNGFSYAVLRRDIALMQFIGMNVFQAGGYPPSWELAELCDRLGMMIISSAPVHGLFHEDGQPEDVLPESIRRGHKLAINEMIDTLGNHPSVVMWSVANQPASEKLECAAYLKDLYLHTKDRDPSRPVVFMNSAGDADVAGGVFDIVAVNAPRRSCVQTVQEAERRMQGLIEEMHRRHGKPVLVCEFGEENASEIAHNPPCSGVIDTMEHVAGTLTRAFADYLVRESRGGAAVNQEGIFTRDRQPKQAAWELKRRFEKLAEERAAK